MLLAEVVGTSAAVAAAPGRLAKVDFIARLLREVPGDEITIATSFLSGDLTQRQIGVGYAALSDLTGGFGQAPAEGQQPEPAGGQLPAPPTTPELTLTDTDRVLGQIGQLAGPGSQAERRVLLAGLLARATAPERQFLVRLLAGDLRQGALDGGMTDAIARAADVPVAAVRRASQLSGSLAVAATVALTTADTATDRAAAAAAALAAVGLQVGRPVSPMLAASAPPASQPGSDGDGGLPLTLFLFDVLHLDGQDMIDIPAAERFARLSAVAPPELVIPRLVTSDVAEAETFFADAISRGHEGVVVKSV